MTRTLCALALILFAGPALAGDIVGNARVIDGDTVEIDWVRVHLQGIDAPELGQTCEKGGKLHRCGDVAAAALWKQAMAPVRCAPVEDSTPDRVLAKRIVGYIELNAWMVTRRYAVAGRKNACDYLAKEAKARLALRGVWHGRFEYPWDWRKARQQRRGRGRLLAIGALQCPRRSRRRRRGKTANWAAAAISRARRRWSRQRSRSASWRWRRTAAESGRSSTPCSRGRA